MNSICDVKVVTMTPFVHTTPICMHNCKKSHKLVQFVIYETKEMNWEEQKKE